MLFAGDASIIITNSNHVEPQATFNTTLTDIISWFQANFLSFNFNEMYYIEFRTKNCIDTALHIIHFNKSTANVTYKACSKKDQTFAIKTLLLILQHFKHCPLQSSPLDWRNTVPNVSSIVGMLPGKHFLWCRAVLLSHFPESPLWFGNDVLSKWFGKQEKVCWSYLWRVGWKGHNRCLMFCQITVDEERCVSRPLSWCNIQAWFSHISNLFLQTASLERAKTFWYNCVFIIQPRGTNSWWTMPFQSKNTTNITLIFDWLIPAFFGWGDPFPIHCDDSILVSTSYT